MPADSALRSRLMEVALGERPADLVVHGAWVLDVFTATFVPEQDVAVASGRIAYVGPDGSQSIGPTTTIVEAEGRTVLPGFIEGHTHLFANRYSLEEFLRYAVPGGTTTVITEITELGSVLGYQALRAAIDGLSGQPIKLFATLPPLAALMPHAESVAPSVEQYRGLLARPEVLGLGEVYWGNLVRGDQRLAALVESALQAGKVAEGHGAGARGPKLQAYVCAGISSDHEPITAEDGLERLRLGLTFMARDGEIRQDLEAIAPIWQEPRDLRRMALVTDGVGAEMLLEHGYLERNVQKAIDLGLEPARAVQMVTLNVAEHFKIDADVGAIAPGRCADFVLVPDERTIRPSLVLSDGRVVARDGELLEQPRPLEWPRRFFKTIGRKRLLKPEDFRVGAPLTPWVFSRPPLPPTRGERGQSSAVRVRAIECVTGLVTQEAEIELPVRDGEVLADPETGIWKVAAIDRLLRTEALFVGFVKGYGLMRGAVASSITWDSQCLIVIGADERDMAMAVNRLIHINGGAAVCADERLLAHFEAPLGGVLSQAPIPEIAKSLKEIRAALHALASPWPNPLLTAEVLTTASIPFFRITDRGYVRVRTGEPVGLFLDR